MMEPVVLVAWWRKIFWSKTNNTECSYPWEPWIRIRFRNLSVIEENIYAEKQTDGWKDRIVGGQKDGLTYGQAMEWKEAWTNVFRGRWTNTRKDGADDWTYRRNDGRRVDKRVDGRKDGRTDEWTIGQADEPIMYFFLHLSMYVKMYKRYFLLLLCLSPCLHICKKCIIGPSRPSVRPSVRLSEYPSSTTAEPFWTKFGRMVFHGLGTRSHSFIPKISFLRLIINIAV